MLDDYGVVVGDFTGHTTEQGQWFHVDLNIAAGQSIYQAAVDVNEVNGQFQYQIFDNLDQSLFAAVSAMPDGWHPLASTPTSGAIDYARDAVFGAKVQSWTNVTGNEAGIALIAMVSGSTKVYAFGAGYATGLGVHDVHCNQGDPPGPHQSDDGVWQDGCIFAIKADGSLSAYLGKFATQTLNTDNVTGLPL